MSPIKVIITGATGMVGEGVLFECLQNEKVAEVLIVSRRHYGMQHPKLKELLVPDFFKLDDFAENLKGYDACFFCAGVSSVGKNEVQFTHLTYNTTMAFAQSLIRIHSNMVFTYISGTKTDSSEKSKMMWARVKGKTENDLAKLPFKAEYNFRPGVMKPFPNQKNWKPVVKFLVGLVQFSSPKSVLTLQEVGRAMIHAVTISYPKNVLEVLDIRQLANEQTDI
ncbi:MAG: NAD-dependent epimerase/dehydratase family protein [Ginsengibacter sp.]